MTRGVTRTHRDRAPAAGTLPGWALSLPPAYAEALREGDPAVVARIEHDHCLVDLRCVPPESDDAVLRAIQAAQR